jgi:hypothetical protein
LDIAMNSPSEEQRQRIVLAKVMAADVLALAATKVSTGADQFANWLLAGIAAALALLVSNLEKVQPFIEVSAIRTAARWFMVAFIVGVFEKLLALWISSAAGGFIEARQIGKESQKIDLSVYFEESKKAFFRPIRWIPNRNFDRILKGDVVAASRAFVKISHIQAALAIVEAVFVFVSLWTIVAGLRVPSAGVP